MKKNPIRIKHKINQYSPHQKNIFLKKKAIMLKLTESKTLNKKINMHLIIRPKIKANSIQVSKFSANMYLVHLTTNNLQTK
jgi:hypothetical protein